MPVGNLPKEAKAIFDTVYDEQRKSGKSESASAQIAWGAVKRSYRKTESGEWVKKVVSEFSMYISKASTVNGVHRWQAVSSDIHTDLHGERMSNELFGKFIDKVNRNEPPPSQFKDLVCSDFWCGGMPYPSIAHYSDLNGDAVSGETTELFIDGDRMKAKGFLYNNALGNAVFKALQDDENNKLPDDERIRISIAFLDLAHKHGENGKVFKRNSYEDICDDCMSGLGDKIYTDGYLVHLALTRVPANPRTSMGVEKNMGKIKTKKQDAASIVGDELAETIAEKDKLAKKSAVMVEFSQVEDDETAEHEEAEMKEDKKDEYKAEKESMVTDSAVADSNDSDNVAVAESAEVAVATEKAERDEVGKEVESLKSEIEQLKSKLEQPIKEKSELDFAMENLVKSVNDAVEMKSSVDDKLHNVQPMLENLAGVITDIVKKSADEKIEAKVAEDNALMAELKGLREQLRIQQEEFAMLKSKLESPSTEKSRVPAPRSVAPSVVKSRLTDEEHKPSSIRDLVRRSVGLE